MIKRRAVKQYLNRLPALLKKDYGSSKECSVGQVKASIIRHKLNLKHSYLACFLFVDKESFKSSELGTLYDYQTIKNEYDSNLSPSSGILGSIVDFTGGDGGNDFGGNGE